MSRTGRRRGAADTLVVISWRDIPAQVNVGQGRDKVQRILPRRFQKAIDKAAMVAGKTQASDYVAEWRRTTEPLAAGAEPEAAAIARADELEAAFPATRLDTYVATGGWAPEAESSSPSASPDPTTDRPTDPAPGAAAQETA